MKPSRFITLLVLALVTMGLLSCQGPVDKTVQALDGAIAALQSESANWRTILEETRDKLTDQAQSTIRHEINSVLQRAIAASGVEFRCDVDFIRKRVLDDLIRIRAEILEEPIPPKEPTFCHVDPLIVEVALVPDRQNHIAFYGYDFDTTSVQILLQNGTEYIDVTQHLNHPSHYALTLNLGANGVKLQETSQRFILKWNNREISSIGIVQPPIVALPTTYEVSVNTSCNKNAGTDADIYVTLFGKKGHSGEKLLDTPNHDDFERCSTGRYRISTNDDLGDLQLVRIWHNNKNNKAGWLLDGVDVVNLRTGQIWKFPCGRWLATDEDDHSLMRELHPGGPCQ